MTGARILIVEDEVVLAINLSERLHELGHTVVGKAATGEEALQLTADLHPDLVLMDIRLAGLTDGITAADRIRSPHGPPVIYLTAHADDETLLRARLTEPFGYLHKPYNDRDLRTAIAMGLYKHGSERKLRESEERYAATLNSISDGIIAVDCQGKVTLLNPVAEQLTGWSHAEAQGKPVQEVFPLIDEKTREWVPNPATEALRDKAATLDRAALLVARNGREVPINDTASPIQANDNAEVQGAVLAFRDISARKQAEEALRNAQKLESLGLLAGGIAHDFNNLLTPVLGYATVVASELPPDSPLQGMLQQIERSARRAAELTQQLLAYAGEGKFLLQPIDLSALIRDMEVLLVSSVSKKARLEFDFAAALPAIDADLAQLRQLVLNLLTNASEALGEGSGSIGVRTGVRPADAEELRSPFLANTPTAGEYVSLEVTDTGCGMSAPMLSRIFDPFFTTKFTGRGLGLAAVLGIIRSLHGTIKVRSEVGKGSAFEVLLPRSNRVLSPPPAKPTLPPAGSGRGTVLVIDDEEAIRGLIRYTLGNAGMKVLTAPDGEQAVALFRQYAAEIDAVLLDLTMPGLNGQETFNELLRIKAGTPVILMSGYSPEDVALRFTGQSLAGIIQKPFRPHQLLSLIRRTLQR